MPHTTQPHFPVEPWYVSETGFDPRRYRSHEGVLALANGYMGQRASFEEGVSGVESLRGSYVAGVFDSYPNPVMIRLKGRPSHPSEMVNIPDFLPLLLSIDGEPLDLATCTLEDYRRTLHMDTGVLTRAFTCTLPSGRRVQLASPASSPARSATWPPCA